MIELLVKSPKIDTVIFTDKISVNYEVKDTDGVFDKVIFEVFDSDLSYISRRYKRQIKNGI